MATGRCCSAAIFLFGGHPSGETRAVVGLEEYFDVVLGIEDFTVDTVIWYVTLVSVILRGSSAYSKSGGELRISDKAFAIEQRVITRSQIPAFGHYVIGLSVETLYAWVIGCYQLLHTLFVHLVINPTTSEPLNCASRPICE